MKSRTASKLAWGAWAVIVSVLVAFGVLTALRWSLMGADRAGALQSALLAIAYSTMGALIASRRPRNAIGWIFLGVGLSTAISALGNPLSTTVPLGRPDTPIGADVGDWLNQWVWTFGWFSIPTLILLLFPDGRPPHPRFRVFTWIAVAAIAGGAVGGILSPDGSGNGRPHFHNPIPIASKTFDQLAGISFLLFLVAALGSLAGLVYRFRRSRGDEREQLKWFVYAAIATGVLYFGLSVEAKTGFLQALGFLAIPLLPTATAIAILRYRLYDIDRIISRTITYTLVTAVVAGVYVFIVLVPTAVVGTERAPTVLIAGATIVAAALFRPLLGRVRRRIDRRFNRSRYDAAWAIDAFAARLRDEVDIDELTNDLQTLVHQTMEPAHVSVWLRDRPT